MCFFLTYEAVKRHLTPALEPWASQGHEGLEGASQKHSPSKEKGQNAGPGGSGKSISVRGAAVEAVTGLVSGGLAGIAVSLLRSFGLREIGFGCDEGRPCKVIKCIPVVQVCKYKNRSSQAYG